MGTGWTTRGHRCRRCHGQPDRMARCTCTGNSLDPNDTPDLLADLAASIDATKAERAGREVPSGLVAALGSSQNPFAGWDPQPDYAAIGDAVADFYGIDAGDYDAGVAVAPTRKGGDTVTLIGVANMDPHVVDALRRNGRLDTLTIVEMPSTKQIVVADVVPSRTRGAMVEVLVERDTPTLLAYGARAGTATALDRRLPGAWKLAAAGRVAQDDPDVYWTAETGKTRAEFDAAHTHDWVVTAKTRRPDDTWDAVATQAATGNTSSWRLDPQVGLHQVDHEIVIDPTRDTPA